MKENKKYKLEINTFGKFTFKEFDLSNTTVFYGDNESGKTTLFDALLSSLSKPDKTKYSSDIKKRYEQTDIILHPTIADDDKLPISMYMNVYAIRQSDIFIDIADNSEWQKIIRSSLYDTDIDLDSIIDDVVSEKNSNAQGSIKSDIKKFNGDYSNIREELDSLYAKEKEITGDIIFNHLKLLSQTLTPDYFLFFNLPPLSAPYLRHLLDFFLLHKPRGH